jgi:hypothetical protein
MSRCVGVIVNRLYYVVGALILALSLVVTLGGLFSSVGFGLTMVLLVDVPIAFGLLNFVKLRSPATLLMAFGCMIVVLYICVATYFHIKAGFSVLSFHLVWASLSLIEMALSIFEFMQLRHTNGVTSWQR